MGVTLVPPERARSHAADRLVGTAAPVAGGGVLAGTAASAVKGADLAYSHALSCRFQAKCPPAGWCWLAAQLHALPKRLRPCATLCMRVSCLGYAARLEGHGFSFCACLFRFHCF